MQGSSLNLCPSSSHVDLGDVWFNYVVLVNLSPIIFFSVTLRHVINLFTYSLIRFTACGIETRSDGRSLIILCMYESIGIKALS